MAGIQALIDQKYGKQGNANYVYYALAANQFNTPRSESLQRQSTTGALPAASCVFNDVTAGDMDVPCGQNSKGKSYDCFGDGTDIIG